MRAVRIGEIAGHEDVLRPNLLEQLVHDRDVLWSDLFLTDLAGLIKGKVEKACRRPRQTDSFDSAHRFRFANDALDILNFRNVYFTRPLSLEEGIHLLREIIHFHGIDQPVAPGAHEEVNVSTDVVIEYGDVATRLI